jgi:branched-chain amino acid transport system substrate-binding protein
VPRLRVLLIVVVTAACLTACSGGEGDGATDGAPRRATGEPLVVGLLNMDASPLGSFPELRRDAEVAARYVNEELGGVDGRPLQLEACGADGTAESSRACATELVAKRPVAVLGGVDLGGDGSLPVLEGAGVPYVGLTPGLGAELTSSSSFMLAGGIAADLLAQVDHITGALKATNVGVVHQSFPGLQAAAVLVARAILQKRGVTNLRIVPVADGVADLAPAVRAATVDRPEVLLAVFPAQGCGRVLDAARAVRLTSKLFLPSSCLDPDLVSKAGTLATEVTFASSLLPYTDAGHPEVATYLDRMRRYGSAEAQPSALSQAGFALVMDLHRQLSELDRKKLTAAALTSRLRTARNQPAFMGHPFSCDGQAVTILPAICSTSVRVLRLTDGALHDVTGDWANGAGLVKLLTG